MESGGLINISQAVLKYWEGLKMTLKSFLFWGGSQNLYYRLVSSAPAPTSDPGSFYLWWLFLQKPGSTSSLCLSVPAGPGQTEVHTLDPSPNSSFVSLLCFYHLLPRDLASWPRRGISVWVICWWRYFFFFRIGSEFLWAIYVLWFPLSWPSTAMYNVLIRTGVPQWKLWPVAVEWTGKPGALPSMGSQRVKHDLATEQQ